MNVSLADEKQIPHELGNCRATSELLKRFYRQFRGEEERAISYIHIPNEGNSDRYSKTKIDLLSIRIENGIN